MTAPWFADPGADPFARGGGRHGFWWADATYIRPGLYLRRQRVLAWPFSTLWRYRRTSWWWPFLNEREQTQEPA